MLLRGVLGALSVGASLLGAPARAGWVAPLAGPLVVRRGFVPPSTAYGPGHRGVDLTGRPSEVVRAAGPGIVSVAGLVAGRGVVAVRHGAVRTTYEPLAALVHVGDRVAAGTPLGRLLPGHGLPRPGETLLHWGLLRGTTYLDPLALLRPEVRLLPMWPAAGRSVESDAPHARTPADRSPAMARPPATAGRAGTPVVPIAVGLFGGAAGLAVSRARRRAWRAAGARPSYASGRSGSR